MQVNTSGLQDSSSLLSFEKQCWHDKKNWKIEVKNNCVQTQHLNLSEPQFSHLWNWNKIKPAFSQSFWLKLPRLICDI